MPYPDDHDQRFKELIRLYLPSLIAMRFPDWVDRFDFTHVDWLSQEIFLDAPLGSRRQIDLLVKVPVKRPIPRHARQVEDAHVCLIHIEIENTDPLWVFRQRLYIYITELSKRHPEPILPLVVFLDRKLDGIGWDSHEITFWEEPIASFRYPYLALPGLKASDYLDGPNILAVALTSLMDVPAQRKLEVSAEALRRIATSGENDQGRYLLAECTQAYSDFSEKEWDAYQRLLTTPRYREARIMRNTLLSGIYDKGKLEGKVEGNRELLAVQLGARFGPLSPSVLERLNDLDEAQLHALSVKLLKARSLKSLGLAD